MEVKELLVKTESRSVECRDSVNGIEIRVSVGQFKSDEWEQPYMYITPNGNFTEEASNILLTLINTAWERFNSKYGKFANISGDIPK